MESGILLVGCGKMGGALLRGWRASGVAHRFYVVEPDSDLRAGLGTAVEPESGVVLAGSLSELGTNLDVDAVIFAVKPQVMAEVVPEYRDIAAVATVISIAAGVPIAFFERAFGDSARVIRCMPNMPAAVAAGITAVCGNARCSTRDVSLCRALLQVVGEVVVLQQEADMDAVTGLSGSGPAYVFYMMDCLAAAGVAMGLDEDVSMLLAKHTVAGAGKLALQSEDSPSRLRMSVTSAGGTTAAGLEVLMRSSGGLDELVGQTVAAATRRSIELGQVNQGS